MRKIIITLYIISSQFIFAQESTLIYEINGRRTVAEEDYIKRIIKEKYETEKENIINDIVNSLGEDLESPTVTLPEEFHN